MLDMEKNGKEPRSKARALRQTGETLRACDLMIGDLVWSEITERYARVDQLCSWGGIGTENGKFEVPNDKVSGVPITGELLKGMGFEQNKEDSSKFYTKCRLDITLEHLIRNKWNVNVSWCHHYEVIDGVVVQYVHELQHVLRILPMDYVEIKDLCERLNKDIDDLREGVVKG